MPLSAQQICIEAATIAKGPGMLSHAGVFLNVILEDLKLNRNLKINRVTESLSVSAGTGYGPYVLPGDYLRTYDLFYAIAAVGGGQNSQGQIIMLNQITMEQMDQEIKQPQISNYPYEFATDLSTDAQVWSGGQQGQGNLTSAGQIFVYPATSGVLVLTHRYMKNQPDITTPQTNTSAPWFPYSGYLIEALASKMMGVTGDDRKDAYEASAERMLFPFLIMEGDEQQTVKNVRLDPRKFRPPRGVRGTKAMPF